MKNFYCYVFAGNAWRAYLNSSQPHTDLSLQNNQYFQNPYSQKECFVNTNEYHYDDMIPLKLGLFILFDNVPLIFDQLQIEISIHFSLNY